MARRRVMGNRHRYQGDDRPEPRGAHDRLSPCSGLLVPDRGYPSRADVPIRLSDCRTALDPRANGIFAPARDGKSFSFAAGVWNHSCSQCHATSTKPLVTTAEQMQTQVADFGIACEACHGPGEEHIRAVREQKTENLQIVNPNDLDAKISSQVCGQCHAAISLADKGATADWLQHGWRYRPGEELDKSKTIIQPASDSEESIDSGIFWNDGTVRVSGREFNGLLKSPCYNHGGDTGKVLRCTSCHNMHLDTESADELGTWSNHQLKPDMRSNLACTQCHEEYREEAKLVAHTHHSADSGEATV